MPSRAPSLIFEARHQGHRLHFLGLLVAALLEHGHEVVVATSTKARNSGEWLEFVGDLEGRIDVRIIEGPGAEGRRVRWRELSWVRALMELTESVKPGSLFIPDADAISVGAAVLRGHIRSRCRSIFTQGLFVRSRFAYGADGALDGLRSSVSSWVVKRSPWDMNFFLDPQATSHARGLYREFGGDRAVTMPEPIERVRAIRRATARKRLGIPIEGKTLVLPGAVDERKGGHLLVRAFAEANLGPDVRLVLAGRVEPKLNALLEGEFGRLSRSGSVIVIDRFLSTEEFWSAIYAADVVCAPYPRHFGSSGVALRTAYARRPLLTSSFGWLGETTRRYELGLAVDVTNTRDLIEGLRHATRELAGAYTQSEAAKVLVARNNPEAFKTEWLRHLPAP